SPAPAAAACRSGLRSRVTSAGPCVGMNTMRRRIVEYAGTAARDRPLLRIGRLDGRIARGGLYRDRPRHRTPYPWRRALSLPASDPERAHVERRAVQGRRAHRRVAAVPGVFVSGDAVEAREGVAAAE